MSSENSFLAREVTYNSESGSLSPMGAAGGGGGGNFLIHHGGGTAPPPTLVTTAGSNLEFNFIWDSSVSNLGSNESAFMNAIVNVAKYYESGMTAARPEVINIQVGWGEVNGSSLPNGAIGASETNGYLTNYSTVTNGLIGSSGGAITANSFHAVNEPTGAQFFISSAEAKGFGLINPMSTGVDGYMGFGTLSGTGYSWNPSSSATTGAGSGTGPLQFDFQGVAQHELSEVMGRIEMEGHTVFNGQQTYTPLDLFNYSAPDQLVLSGGQSSGSQVNSYFSLDSGTTNLGWFNDGYKNGDIADWASYSSYSQSNTGVPGGYQDSFDAFAYPGINTDLSTTDEYVLGTLGLSATAFA
jgi:hypothetical protein